MKPKWIVATIGGVLALILVFSMMVLSVSSDVDTSTDDDDCSNGASTDTSIAQPVVSGETIKNLTAEQSNNAQIIVGVGKQMSIPTKGLVVAIAAARQESDIKNLKYGDRDSQGLFQMRPSQGWGTVAQVTNPTYAAHKFFTVLSGVKGWQSMSVTQAAQAVERSGFPDAYAQWESLAVSVVASITGGSTSSAAGVAPVAATNENYKLRPVTITAKNFVRSHFGFTGTIGGYAPGTGHIADSKHYQGLAIDVMVESDTTLGHKIANYFAGPGYKPFHVDNVIYYKRIYNAGKGWHAYPDRGNATLNHMDHVHIDFHDVSGAAANITDALDTITDPIATDDCQDAEEATYTNGSPVVFPVPVGDEKSDRHNYGERGQHWASRHTGTDFSLPCGTPALAATDGKVTIVNGPSWYGTWLVKVSTGAHSLTTWYAHMQKLTVTDGQTVKAGDQVGEIGARGNATGCHLHFEVHPKNGVMYQDDVNPSNWLAHNVGKTVGGSVVPISTGGTLKGSGGFVIASFNVLGDSHYREHPGMARGPRRAQGVARLIENHNIDVVGFQEMQGVQAAALRRIMGGTFRIWHPSNANTENSIGFRTSVFELVKGRSISIPYFNGHARNMPVALLRYKPTGQTIWVADFHNPAETGTYHHQGAFRAEATRREKLLATRLIATGSPVFIVGDMNERASYFCKMSASGEMHAAAGGRAHPCSAPHNNGFGIDWIFGSGGINFSDFAIDHGKLDRWTTDHPVAMARVN